MAAIGLVHGFVGAVLMYRFGVPRYPEKSRAGAGFIRLEEDDEDEKRSVDQADRWGRLGVALVAAGFVFQLLGLVWGT